MVGTRHWGTGCGTPVFGHPLLYEVWMRLADFAANLLPIFADRRLSLLPARRARFLYVCSLICHSFDKGVGLGLLGWEEITARTSGSMTLQPAVLPSFWSGAVYLLEDDYFCIGSQQNKVFSFSDATKLGHSAP